MISSVNVSGQIFSIFLQEQENNDPILCSNNVATHYNRHNVPINDQDYSYHDRTTSIFSTMGVGLSAMHCNNIVTAIRSKRISDMDLRLTAMIGDKVMPPGVYIVDYYNIYNDPRTDIDKLIAYYDTTKNLVYDKATNDGIIASFKERAGSRYKTKLTARIITFIPATEITEYGYVYVEKSDVVIINGDVNDSIAHPSSRIYKDYVKNYKENNKNLIILDVVDNDNSQPYFIRVGTYIHRFFPTKDPDRKNGCILNIKKQGADSNVVNCSLEHMPEALGIYKSRREAQGCGNISATIEEHKLKLDLEKLSLEKDKLRHEADKLRFEARFYKEKYQHELNMMEQKFKIADLDIAIKYINQGLELDKMSIAMLQKANEHGINIRTMQAKYELEESKAKIDMVVKIVTIGISMLKFI